MYVPGKAELWALSHTYCLLKQRPEAPGNPHFVAEGVFMNRLRCSFPAAAELLSSQHEPLLQFLSIQFKSSLLASSSFQDKLTPHDLSSKHATGECPSMGLCPHDLLLVWHRTCCAYTVLRLLPPWILCGFCSLLHFPHFHSFLFWLSHGRKTN